MFGDSLLRRPMRTRLPFKSTRYAPEALPPRRSGIHERRIVEPARRIDVRAVLRELTPAGDGNAERGRQRAADRILKTTPPFLEVMPNACRPGMSMRYGIRSADDFSTNARTALSPACGRRKSMNSEP